MPVGANAQGQGKGGGRKRQATVVRKTKETDIRIELALDGSGQYEVSTEIPFFDHMLESFARHGLFDLKIAAKGDVEVDLHHTVEDVGLALGEAIRQALGSAEGIQRFGQALLPMAEAKVEVAVDVSNRPYLVYRVDTGATRIGTFEPSLAEDFLQALAQTAGLDLHVELRYGRSAHHIVEAVFKGVARALRVALSIDPRQTGLPTVKGAL